jgi:hypothetical protein
MSRRDKRGTAVATAGADALGSASDQRHLVLRGTTAVRNDQLGSNEDRRCDEETARISTVV